MLDSEIKGSLVELIEQRFREKRVIPPLKAEDRIHASAFASLCPREEVLASLFEVTREQESGPDELLTFAIGSGLHGILQNEVLPLVGALRGKWVCNVCGSVYGESPSFTLKDPVKRPDTCTGKIGRKPCPSTTFSFCEYKFIEEEYGISGRPDGFIEIPDREGLGVLEAKSISPRGAWTVKKVPKFEHVIQAQIYMWFTGATWACLLYWDKGTYGIDALIEHFVDRDEDTIEAVKEGLLSIRNGIRTGILPPRICQTSTCERAKACALRDPCFSTAE